jgi:hypothetical protein
MVARNSIRRSIMAVLSNKKFWTSALLGLIGAAGGVVAKGTWDRCCAEKPIFIPVAVVPTKGGNGDVVAGADVYLGIPEIASKQTDPFGIAHFENVPSQFRGRVGHVSVRKDGFLPSNPNDYPLAIQPRNWKEPFVVSITRIAPPPQIQPPALPPAKAKLTEDYRSGPQASGPGKAFSQWYTLCSRNPPPDYVIEKDSFRLVGDRSCGGWANCEKESSSPTQVCWKFQMQGHDEWGRPFPIGSGGGSGVAFSEGMLTVVWAPK